MAASSSAVSEAKNITQAESLQAIHIPSINRNSHNSAPLLPSPVSLQNLTNNSADLSSTNYNCANCDIKFDSESSLRVHLQYHHGESFLGQNSAAPPGSWLSHRLPGSTGPTAAGVGSTSSSTIPGIPATNPSFVDTGLSPPPSSNNSNVAADEQPQLKPLHINNNIPSSYPNSTSTGQHVNTNTPTPPSSAEAISPSSVSSAATMISYEPLPSAIGTSHHLQQQSQIVPGLIQPQTQQMQVQHVQQQAQQQQHQLQQMQQMHQMQQQHQQQQQQAQQQQYTQQQQQQLQHQGREGDNSNLDYDIDASSSAEEIWDLDSHTVKRYNNASGDTSASGSTGHGSMESPMGSYGDLSVAQSAAAGQHHYVPTNPMWGTGSASASTMYPHQQQQQHGFPTSSHEIYRSNDWLHSDGSGSLKRPSSNHSDEAKRMKTYQCEACDKWFTSSGHLKRHFNTTLHKNATRHHHKSGGGSSPRIGTPIMSDLEPMGASNSISNLNTTSTSTLNSSPSPIHLAPPGSPHHPAQMNPAAMAASSAAAVAAAAAAAQAAAAASAAGTNNNVPNSPRAAFYNSRNSSPAGAGAGSVIGMAPTSGTSPAKNNMMMNMLPNMRPLPSMKESLSHIKNNGGGGGEDPVGVHQNDWSSTVPQQPQIIQRGYNLYSPDSVSAVNRSTSGYSTADTMSMSTASVAGSDYGSGNPDLYNLQPPPQPQQQQVQQQPQNFNYHGHYNMEYSHTNGGNGVGQYMMYQQPQQPQMQPQRGYHHPSDMSNYNPHSEGGSVKDELDQLSVATGDLDEGLSETGTPATPTDSLEGPPTPRPALTTGNGSIAQSVTPSGTPHTPGNAPSGEYRCVECNKVFNRLCYLKQHNKSFHNGEKPFKCGQCGKRFPVEVLYQEHMAKHQGDKPYKCEVCPKQFNHKTDLRRHMCLHTGEKPFACDVCGKGFIREDRMVKHSDTHKKKQPILMT